MASTNASAWDPFDVSFFFVKGSVFDISKSEFDSDLFEISKIYYHMKAAAKAAPKVAQLFLLMFYFWVGNVYWTFKIRRFHLPF